MLIAKTLVAYLHFVCAFGIAATLFFEWFTFSAAPTLQEARRIAWADRAYGVFALLMLIVGVARAVHFEKGLGYYLHNPFFHLKLALFVAVGLLSIYPTIRFIRWQSELREGRAPQLSPSQHKTIARCLAAQMVALALLLLSASLMANGIGMG